MTKTGCFIALTATVLLATSGVTGQSCITQYTPPPVAGATTCTKNYVGNTPATCPCSLVPLTAEGKPGSTVCVSTADGRFYEGVFSLMYPSTDPSAIPGCTRNSQCGSDPSVVCGTNGVNGGVSTCFPLAPSGCPFTGDTVNSSTTASTGRKLHL